MNWGRLYLGLLIVVGGVLLLLDSLGVLDAGETIGDWWPAAVVGFGLLTLAANPGRWRLAVVITAIGAALLLATLDVADIGGVLISLVIIFLGLAVVFGRGLRKETGSGDTVNSFNVFSGTEIASHSDQFRGGSVSAMFGGVAVDLRDALPAPGAELDVLAAFGGVEIRVPEGWQVISRGMPLFGGIENVTTKERLPADAPTLRVNATALLGGIEIKH